MAKKYLVKGQCDNVNCRTYYFEKVRKNKTYSSTDGHEHPIERITCPDCGMLGHVVSIVEVIPAKAVA